MSRTPAFFLAALLLSGCAETLTKAEVETVTPSPPPPVSAPPPPLDLATAGLVDVVTNAEPARLEPVIDVEFRTHAPVCEGGGCKMHIWRDGLVSFDKRHEKKTGWSHVRRADVARWLAGAEEIAPSPTATRERMRRCRRYRYSGHAEVTFHLTDRKLTMKTNDPCIDDRTADLLLELSTAAPVPEGH